MAIPEGEFARGIEKQGIGGCEHSGRSERYRKPKLLHDFQNLVPAFDMAGRDDETEFWKFLTEREKSPRDFPLLSGMGTCGEEKRIILIPTK